MKKTITVTTTKEIELPEFPFYTKEGNHFAKIINEDVSFLVYANPGYASISKRDREIDMERVITWELCEKQEFETAFYKALKIIQF